MDKQEMLSVIASIRTRLKHSPRSESATHGLFALGLILAALLVNSACGFKLRGQVEIPPELSPVFVGAQGGSPVRNEIIRQLRESQVQLATVPRHARTIIRISSENHSSRVVAVDRGGKVLARALRYTLTFDAVTPDGKELVPQQSIDLERSYEDSGLQELGKQLESELIYKDMIGDAADRILARLRAALR